MSLFGWSYPPGCSGTPYDEIQYCEICGLSEYKCQCPECEECGETGIRTCAGKPGHLPDLIPSILWMEHLLQEFGESYGNGINNDRDAEAIIRKTLFKATRCGVSFGMVGDSEGGHGIFVAGYCEGYDGDHPQHILLFPFTPKQFWDKVELADADGVETWNDTHGCEKCAELIGGYNPETGEACEGYDGVTHVHPDCENCGGSGVVF